MIIDVFATEKCAHCSDQCNGPEEMLCKAKCVYFYQIIVLSMSAMYSSHNVLPSSVHNVLIFHFLCSSDWSFFLVHSGLVVKGSSN